MNKRKIKFNDKIKNLLLYILPTILIFAVIWNYLKIDLDNNRENVELSINIFKEVKAELQAFMLDENDENKTFKKSFIEEIRFHNIEKRKELNYVEFLIGKCSGKGELSSLEASVLESYKLLIKFKIGEYASYETFNTKKYKLFGFLSYILLFIILIIISNKLRNKELKFFLKYYLILFFITNIFAKSYNKTSLTTLEMDLNSCIDNLSGNKELDVNQNNVSLAPTVEFKPENHLNKIDSTWNKVYIKETGTIYLPQTLEIQDGIYKKFVEGRTKKMGFEVSDLVAQNKGTNNFEGAETYARVMLTTVIGEKNDFEELDFEINKYTEREIIDIGNNFKEIILNQFSSVNQKTEKEAKLINWYQPELIKINGASCLHLRYERQLSSSPIVKVNSYIFFNNDKMHTLVLSYRKSDSDLWKEDIVKILNSLKIIKS